MASQLTSKIFQRSALRRILISAKNSRGYHASACMAADALDMTDTFPRRHCES